MDWQVVGHDWAVAVMRRSLAKDRVAHAYLLSGPSQVGKTRFALSLARALNCTEPDPPCGHCLSCRKIEKGNHPDVRLVVGEGAGESIKIEQVRAMGREAALAPYEGRYRILVLRHADRASVEAANSLLKILEEPPPHFVLILTAQQVEALPSTVVSRCQRLDLRPAASDQIESALLQRGVARDKAQLLARLAGGRVGWAFAASQDGAIMSQRQKDLDLLSELMSADRVRRFDFAFSTSRDRPAIQRRLVTWASWWRDLLLLHSVGEVGVVNIDRIDELHAVAERTTLSEALSGIQAIEAAAVQVEANVNARLALEGLLLRLPRWPAISPGDAA